MKCIHCNGEMERKTSPFQIDRKGYHLTLEKIPAWVCTQCGEAYFEESEVEEIHKMIETLDRETKKLSTAA
jgi:YgiT-type zinc finger domain-containing protein